MSSLPQAPRALRVLLAEDDDCVASVISAGLSKRGHEVTRVATGREALVANEYDALITDDQLLGDMTGVELLEALDVRRTGLPVVYVSGAPSPEHRIAALRAGAVTCLAKPFGLMDLALAVESAVERALHRVEGPTFSRDYAASREPSDRAPRELGAFLMEHGVGPAHRSRILSAVALVLQDPPHTRKGRPVRIEAVVGRDRVEVEVGAVETSEALALDELLPALPAGDEAESEREPRANLDRARSLTESLDVRRQAGREVVCLSFELTPVGFDDEELDLSNADYVDPRVMDRLIEILRADGGHRAHLVPDAMASTVGRLLALSDPNRASSTPFWS